MNPKHVCVMGAGIVGLATAWQLHREGYQVSVIDRDAPGHGASGGNGSQLSYSYVQPLADPSIWKQLPKLLLSPNSPGSHGKDLLETMLLPYQKTSAASGRRRLNEIP